MARGTGKPAFLVRGLLLLLVPLHGLEAQTYTAVDLGPRTLISIAASGTLLTTASSCDDCTQTVPLPFPFEWYGRTVTTIAVSSNGQLNMDGSPDSHCCSAVHIPQSDSNNDRIFVAKEDLNPASGGGIYTLTQGAPGSRTFTVEFQGVPFFPAAGMVNAQAILYENPPGRVDLIWGTGDTAGSLIAAGVEDQAGLDGTPAVSGSYFGLTGQAGLWPSNTGCRFRGGCPGSCADPQPVQLFVTGSPGSRTATATATADTTACQMDDHTLPCGAGGWDVTLEIRAPFSGTATVDTCAGSTFDTLLAALDGHCVSAALACDDDTCGSGSQISFAVSCGHTYTVVVDGAGGTSGTANLTFNLVEAGPVCLNLLIFDDTGPTSGHGPPYAEEFLEAALTLGHTPLLATDEATFTGLLSGQPWDLVACDVADVTLQSTTLSALQTFLASGGSLILGYWNALAHAGHPLFLSEGIQVTSAITGSPPAAIHDWTGGPLVTHPNQLPTLAGAGLVLYPTYGQECAVTSASAELGYTPAPQPGMAAVAIGSSGRFIFNAFILDPFSIADGDGDLKPDSLELAENELTYLLPSTCGGICGDCNRDGVFPAILDALSASRIGAGLILPSTAQAACCDTDQSGAVTITDALRIAQLAAGLSVTLACP